VSSHASSGTTAAGLPSNGRAAKASTCHIFNVIAFSCPDDASATLRLREHADLHGGNDAGA
jgi:hypothetical protein